MAKLDVNQSDTTDYTDIDFSDMDQHSDQKLSFFFEETEEFTIEVPGKGLKAYWLEYTPKWDKWKGYYDKVSMLGAIIDRKAMWVTGEGFVLIKGKIKKKLFQSKQEALEKIRGNGTDNYNIIDENVLKCSWICGDGFAEIVKDKAGRLRNKKPLNPGTITIVANKFGIIKGYYQTHKGVVVQQWKAKDMFHLPWNRIGDAIHGTGIIERMDWNMKAMQEAKADQKTLYHRYVKPLWIFSINTDNTEKKNKFKAEIKASLTKSENLIVPKKTVDSIERVSVPQYATLDPLPWLKFLEKQFIIAGGVPEIILGHGEDTTEASSKILYTGFEILVKYCQRWLEGHEKNQMNIELKWRFSASLLESIKQDAGKDGPLKGEKRSEIEPTSLKEHK